MGGGGGGRGERKKLQRMDKKKNQQWRERKLRSITMKEDKGGFFSMGGRSSGLSFRAMLEKKKKRKRNR